jgi:hypothetical protein
VTKTSVSAAVVSLAIVALCWWGALHLRTDVPESKSSPKGLGGLVEEAVTSYLTERDRGAAPYPWLEQAANLGCTHVLEKLIGEGADPNGRYADGTPLRYAAGRGRGDIVRVLLAAGADPELEQRGTLWSTSIGGAASSGSLTVRSRCSMRACQ